MPAQNGPNTAAASSESVPESSESIIPAKRPQIQESDFDLELEDEDELNALAAQTVLPAKRARLEDDLPGPFNASMQSSFSRSAPSAVNDHSISVSHLDLGVHQNSMAPVEAKTFEGTPLTFFRRRVKLQQVRQVIWLFRYDVA